MQEKNKDVTGPGAEEQQVGQWDQLARNMVRLFDQATKVLGEITKQWVSEPGKLAAAQNELFKDYAELWGRSVRRYLGEEDVKPVVEPEPGDNRFKDPDWSNTQYFDFWKQAYLLTARWAE